ncbi:MAG: hypothetical protein sL5_03510 [Candidatus Mesenet longicola]|uniref:Terminase large subunit gp17-like C-terminal domain-containing protein n=1 Tax=Candidatus Mesenet longicola TaxID=1892558 RepID=A0A8J3MNW2_9RICK|nr:MAG: hypothetical protein sGL2_07660 [Candidatus Mesenet longicola]GHM59358.1 MAG: hypothetical protein sL5_03510 [Candidatus Mesenet longicola]
MQNTKLLINFIELCFDTVSPGYKYYNTWHIKIIADVLQAAFSGKVTRIIVNMPPRSMKSICISVAWPAWILGIRPEARIIVASYSQILSLKHSLDTRCILQSDWYRELFPETKLAQDTQYKFQTTKMGFRFATSVGGTLTGEGGDFLIVDDPLTPMQAASERMRSRANAWFDQTFATRLNDRKTGVIVVVMHRLHPDDLTGHLLEKSGWHHLCLPMIAEEKQTIYSQMRDVLYVREKGELLLPVEKKDVEQIKIELGTYAFAAQYQQHPLSECQIKQEWIKRYRDYPGDLSYVTQSWDTANSQDKDFSACTTWAKVDNMFYLLDSYRAKLEYPSLKQQVLFLAKRWRPHAILIEAKASGQQLIQELKAYSILPIIKIIPSANKITRFHQTVPLIEAGRVFLPHRAVWLSDFEYELFMFPKVQYDDQVDSMTQYLNWVYSYNTPKIVCF